MGAAGGPVFLGTVIQVTDRQSIPEAAHLSSRKAQIRVNELFGGLDPNVSEIDVWTGTGGGDCGVPFKPGETYLVSAYVSNDGLLHASICGSTRGIDEIGAALRVLRNGRDGRKLPSLVGQIAQSDRNFDGLSGTNPPKPLPNALVRVKSEQGAFETQADSEGLYAFYGLPKGRYEFTPDLPPGTTLSWYIGSDSTLPPVELSGSGCQERNIQVFAAGSIQGRVLDASNSFLPDALVYIVPVAEKVLQNRQRLYSASQSKEGFFKFVHIPPGEYLVLVNPDDSRTPEFPFQRTFHPGVQDRDAATLVTLRAGERIEGVDIRLQPQFALRRLGVRVVWADGRSIDQFVYVVAKGTDNSELTSTASTDKGVSVGELKIFPTEQYEVQAKLTCRYSDERSEGPGATLQSTVLGLKPGDDRTEITLTIPATSCPVVPGKTSINN